MSTKNAVKRGRGRPPRTTEPTNVAVTVRFSDEQIKAIDELGAILVPSVQLARHDVIRAAVVRGLEVMRQDAKK